MQLMHRNVQKRASTTLPRSDAIVSGSLVIQSVMPASAGACPRFSSATLAGSVVEIGAGTSGSVGEAAIGWVDGLATAAIGTKDRRPRRVSEVASRAMSGFSCSRRSTRS